LQVAVDAETPATGTYTEVDVSVGQDHIQKVPVDYISRGKYQPRRDMNRAALEELAASIRNQGLLQPIILRPLKEANRYEIIAGERRWRACQMAGLDRVPAIVRDVPDASAVALALIENIQREDLNPIEEALALERLQDEFVLTQQELSEAVGKSRASVANMLRLLKLTDEVRHQLESGAIEMGHAKALLALEAGLQKKAARAVVSKGLSVRQTEALVRQMTSEKYQQEGALASKDPDILSMEEQLGDVLGSKVQIRHTARGKGQLVIHYSSLDELEGIRAHIK
jgi:ParB family chromosome partitioning protein